MAALESLLWDGLQLNDGTTYTLEAFDPGTPAKLPEWVDSADDDGSALIRDPRFDNRKGSMRIRIESQASMDLAIAKVRALRDRAEESERQENGNTLIWLPNDGTTSYSMKVLSAHVPDVPLALDGEDAGWFFKSPVVHITFEAKPYLYGPAINTVLDDFSTDSIGAGKYTFDSGAGTLSVAGGVLVPSSTAIKLLYRSSEGLTYSDAQVTLKYTTGGSVAGIETGLVLRRIDANNLLMARLDPTSLTIFKRVGGVFAALPGATAAAVPAINTTYWIRFRCEGNKLTVEHWTSEPSATGSPAATASATLAGADAAVLGQGIAGSVGARLVPDTPGFGVRYDDLEIVPYVYRGGAPTLQSVLYGVPGEVAAEVRALFTDNAGQTRRHIEWGVESRFYSAGVPTLLDQFGTDTIGSGAWAFDAGTGTLAVTAGQLVPSDTTEKRLHRTDSAAYTDLAVTWKFHTGAAVSGAQGVVGKRLSATDSLWGDWTANTVRVVKRDGGVATALGTPIATGALATNTDYWLRFTVRGNACKTEFFTADPATGATATATINYDLSSVPADAAKFGQGVAGSPGIRVTGGDTNYRYDDYRVLSLAGCTELQIDSESLQTAGFLGTQATRAGAYTGGTIANHVVRGTLSNVAAAYCSTGDIAHVGTYRVKARVYATNTTPSNTKLRLSWQEGDGAFRSLDWVSPPGENNFCEVDLGVITIPEKTQGAQKWCGRLEAYTLGVAGTDVLDFDYIELVPAELYGKARAPVQFETLTTFVARDEFDQTAGNLVGKVLPVGGTWTYKTGDVDDFTVDTVTKTVQRATTADTGSGRYVSQGTTNYANTLVQADVKCSILPTNLNGINVGIFARYVDNLNWTIAAIGPNSAGTLGISFIRSVANVLKQWFVATPTFTAGAFYTIRVLISATGQFFVWLFPQGAAAGAPVLVGQESPLATGGALQTGQQGLFDYNGSATAATRSYDNYIAGTPASIAALFAGKIAQLSTADPIAQRQDSTGVFYGRVDKPGNRIKLPPYTDKLRPTRVFTKLRRNDVDVECDDSIADTHTVQFVITPRYIDPS